MRARGLLVAIVALVPAAACAPAKAPVASATPAAVASATPAASLLASPDADPKAELPALVALAKDGPGRSAFPQADAFVAVNRDDISLAKDGTMTERSKSVVRVLDAQRGKAKFADVHVPWDHDRQTLTVVLARTVNPDGSEHAISDDEVGDIVPPELAGATMYASALERVISFPAVDEGSVVELVWTRVTKPTPDASLGGELPLAFWDPQQLRVVTLTVPHGSKGGSFSVQGTALAAVESDDATAGTHTWTWTEKDLPDRQPEEGAPPALEILPRLLYTFEPDWKTASSSMAGAFRAATANVAAPVKAKADELTAGATSDAARAQALFKFVAQQIRSVPLPLGQAGYRPNPPEKVLENRYGDVRDKVALLLALCAAEKIDGEAVLARSQGIPVIGNVPTLAQFDHLIARLTIAGTPTWVDPNDHDAQFGVSFVGEDNLVLPLGADAPEHRALPDSALSTSKLDERYTIDDKGDLHASLQWDATGWYADAAIGSLRSFKGDRLAQHFQMATGAISAVALDRGHTISDLTTVAGPVKVSHDYLAPGYAPAQGNFRVVEIPPPTFGFMDDMPSTGMAHRDYPLVVTPPRAVDRTVTLTLPSGWHVAWLPPALEGDEAGLHYKTSCEPRASTVICHEQLSLATKEVAPDRYPAFHAALAKLDEYRERVILLTR